METHLERYREYLRRATQAIPHDYFQLPVADREDPAYRERVYCYELYHQLRRLQPGEDLFRLSGEVDKQDHPLIRGGALDHVKPDLLIHIPGSMGGNLIAVEVKPVTAGRGRIVTDLKKLAAFRNDGEYHAAIYLFYGNEPQQLERVRQHCLSAAEEGVDVALIEYYHHRAPEEPAERFL